MKRFRIILLALSVLFSGISLTSAKADISDYVSFPFEESTFDSVKASWGTTYRDSLSIASWNRVRSGPAPFSGELTIWFSHRVNTRSYTFQAELISPSGKSILLSGRESKLESSYSLSCYLTYCKDTYLQYSVVLPANSEVGKYDLRFTAKWC